MLSRLKASCLLPLICSASSRLVSWQTRLAILAVVLFGLTGTACACPVIDLYSPVVAIAHKTISWSPQRKAAEYRRSIVERQVQLYTPEVLGVDAGPALDRKLLTSLEEAQGHAGRLQTVAKVRAALRQVTATFSKEFPDFQCDFPIYLVDSLGQLDGAGREVAGKKSLVLGIDQIDSEQNILSLPVFLSHELFHRYHYQASGFSDDAGERQAIWKALWAEGLATYVSYRTTPGATVSAALILPPDLESRASAVLPRISADLLANADHVDADVFRTYFTYGNPKVKERGLPWRSGYYVGFLVAQRLAVGHSLQELAHLNGEDLRDRIGRVLQNMAHSAAN